MPICKQCKKEFIITNQDKAFYKKMDLPEPSLCVHCRRLHLMCFRNQRHLYPNVCAKTNKKIISDFAPESGYVVYDRDYWWSDDWDPCAYGIGFDFSKNFSQQFDALMHTVPMPAVYNGRTTNSQFCNHVGEMKDCYLVYAGWKCENILYGDLVYADQDSMDIMETNHMNSCYEMVQCINCFHTYYSYRSENCQDSWFLYDCRNCADCIGCTNLRNKQYYIFNEKYSKEEYEKKKTEMKLHTRSGIEAAKQHYLELKKNCIHPFAQNIKCENVSGDYNSGLHNCRWCFGVHADGDNCCYLIYSVEKMTDVFDCYGCGAGYERAYMMFDSGVNATDNICGGIVWSCQYAYYSYNCHSCYEIFGCIGLRNKKFCILNKQYTEDEYKKLKSQIIAHMKKTGEWGQYFPPSISPFYLNESVAYEYTDMTKEEACKLGFKWKDTMPEIKGKETLQPNYIPETILETKDSIVSEVLLCTNCKKNYKIIKPEMEFYRKQNLPIPTQCPTCRYHARLALRNPRNLWHRQCCCEMNHEHHSSSRCTNEFETSYAPEKPEKVFCEECYQKEII